MRIEHHKLIVYKVRAVSGEAAHAMQRIKPRRWSIDSSNVFIALL
jgi:hypothetical protein